MWLRQACRVYSARNPVLFCARGYCAEAGLAIVHGLHGAMPAKNKRGNQTGRSCKT